MAVFSAEPVAADDPAALEPAAELVEDTAGVVPADVVRTSMRPGSHPPRRDRRCAGRIDDWPGGRDLSGGLRLDGLVAAPDICRIGASRPLDPGNETDSSTTDGILVALVSTEPRSGRSI